MRVTTSWTPTILLAPVLLIPVLLPLGAAAASATGGLGAVLPHYERVRVLLVEDTLDGVAEPAESLRRQLEALKAGLTADAAGVPAARLDEVAALLPEAVDAARSLEAADSLESARDAFYALSKPLVRWRQAAGDGPLVAYCPMKRHSWLQPEATELGNPYYGQVMAACGEIVDG